MFRPSAAAAAAACVVLLGTYATLAWTAAGTKNATNDEPTHLISGWLALVRGDYRLEVANPAGWKMLAALPDAGVPLRPLAGGPLAPKVGFDPDHEIVWCSGTLFRSPGVDGDRVVRRARAVMLAANLLLGVAVAGWAFQLAGPVAAVVAMGLFAFDPTMLAHAPLVKSDLLMGWALLTLSWLTWHAGRRLTVVRLAGLAVVSAVAIHLKFTGVLAVPIVGGLLLARAASPTPWPAMGRVVGTRAGRVVVVAGCGVLIATVAVAGVWSVYRFRYRPAPAADVAIDMPLVYRRLQGVETSIRLGRPATPAEATARPPGLLLRAVRWADGHHLLPQAFLAGIAHQAACVTLWQAYLDGQVYTDGRWYYFPLAAAYKTPLAELAAFALAGVIGLVGLRPTTRGAWWSAACVAVPAVLFGVSALRTHLNIGLRTVLPFYAFADVAAGVAAAWAWHRRPRLTAAVAVALLGSLGVTAASAWPDYLPFFNAAVGGPEQGLTSLADSNLDWGQDVTSLGEWHRRHPGVPVYADLFLSVDPDAYVGGVQWLFAPDPATGRMRLNLPDRRPCVIAVSATHLLGLYTTPLQRSFLATLARRPPREVLHGTIYLYDYPPRP